MILSTKNIFFAVVLFALAAPMFTLAQGFEVPDAGIAGLAVETGEGEGIVGAFEQVITFLASILAVLSILIIVIAGILYITSGGDQDKIDSAKTWLTYAIIGLVVALLAWVIVRTVATALGA